MLLDECFAYINRLYVPDGFEIEAITITEAKSMTSGYNEAMSATDAKYKVYMHQDVFIINRFFLRDIIDIFEMDKKIGAIGLAGYKEIDDTGCMWLSSRYGFGNAYGSEMRTYKSKSIEEASLIRPCFIYDVMVTDGFLFVTSTDIEWDEEFDGWDFYDASQGIRMKRKGYRVVVPEQKVPWAVHDDGKFLTPWEYNEYRKIFLGKYGDDIRQIEEENNIKTDMFLKSDEY